MNNTNAINCYAVITDLDGTLLDHFDYSWKAAQPALDFLNEHNIPVVINTSKTAKEVITLQRQIGLRTPFIVENGSAIFLPKSESKVQPESTKELGEYWVKIIGSEKTLILDALATIRREKQWAFEGFSDWSVNQIIEATGLSLAAATEASKREFSEPIVWHDSDENFQAMNNALQHYGLSTLRGGRFTHVIGQANKGKAALWLKAHYQNLQQKPCKLLALGDGPNDIDMLDIADYAAMVKSPAHDFPNISKKPGLIFTTRFGPEGWNEAISIFKNKLI